MLARVVGHIGPTYAAVPTGQSARDELREALGTTCIAYGHLVVRRYLAPPLVATAWSDTGARRMLDGCRLDSIPAGSPGVDGVLVREDLRGFWVRHVCPDHSCRWQLVTVASPFDVMRCADARNAVTADDMLREALIAWGLVPPTRPSA